MLVSSHRTVTARLSFVLRFFLIYPPCYIFDRAHNQTPYMCTDVHRQSQHCGFEDQTQVVSWNQWWWLHQHSVLWCCVFPFFLCPWAESIVFLIFTTSSGQQSETKFRWFDHRSFQTIFLGKRTRNVQNLGTQDLNKEFRSDSCHYDSNTFLFHLIPMS